MPDPMQEIRASFFVECEELLEALQDGLVRLDGDGFDTDTINVVFRAVHSIKGGAGAFALDDLVAFAHVFETLLDELRAQRVPFEPELSRLLFRGADTLSDLVRAARDGATADGAAVAAVRTDLEAAAGGTGASDQAAETVAFTPAAISLDLDIDLDPTSPEGDPAMRNVAIRFAPGPELYAAGNEPLFLFRALAALGDLHTRCTVPQLPPLSDYDPASAFLSWDLTLETPADTAEIREVFEFVEGLCQLEIDDPAEETSPPDSPESEAPSAAKAPSVAAPVTPPPQAPKTGASPAAPPTVRVDLDRIERLVNLVGELVINQAMLSQSVTEAGMAADPKIAAGLDEFLQLTRDIQDSVMMIRAQPVKSLFQRMGRIVREASAAVGKTVRLETEGESTEIDKTMIERLSDPLTHMIRNAVDHGLEDAASRRAAGKPETGTVTLTAGHRSGRVVIEISDDGGGIDRPKVQRIAESRGLIAPGLTLSDSEIDNLLFLPGFSTASQISNLSGRGVGMDVVKSALSSMGGRIAIASTPGRGTTFSISLPLTLAVLDGMVIRAGGETLVVPLSSIIETLTVAPPDITTVAPGGSVMRVRDTFVPLIDLAVRLGYRPPGPAPDGAIALLIAGDDGARAAVIVDDIVDQRQVVIKGLEDSYGRVPGVAAATILGDGRIALILDPTDVVERRAPALAPLSPDHLALAG